jgi:general secretion pathway protein H
MMKVTMVKYKNIIRGFTLLELLIVIFIMCLASAIIVVSVSGKHNIRETQSFMKLLKAEMQFARKQSILQMKILGLGFDKQHYEFYQYNANQTWSPLKNSNNYWRVYSIPEDVQLNVSSQNHNQEQDSTKQPQIVFLPNGEVTPFIVTAETENLLKKIQIVGSSGGDFVLTENSNEK